MRQHKKWLLAVLGLLIVIVGGIALKNYFTGEEIDEKKLEQDRMVRYLVSNYKDNINKVEFVEYYENELTGTWESTAIVNDKLYVKFTLWKKSREIGMSQLFSRNKGLRLAKRDYKRKNVTTVDVKIIYFEE